jgi:hypothetical protein
LELEPLGIEAKDIVCIRVLSKVDHRDLLLLPWEIHDRCQHEMTYEGGEEFSE